MVVLEELIKIMNFFIIDFNGGFSMITFTSTANVKIKNIENKSSNDYFCVTGENTVYLYISEDTRFIYKIKKSDVGFDIFDIKNTRYKMIADFSVNLNI